MAVGRPWWKMFNFIFAMSYALNKAKEAPRLCPITIEKPRFDLNDRIVAKVLLTVDINLEEVGLENLATLAAGRLAPSQSPPSSFALPLSRLRYRRESTSCDAVYASRPLRLYFTN
nr:hypothetical protein Itr_chr14CG11870 [Ipomoea trifida]